MSPINRQVLAATGLNGLTLVVSLALYPAIVARFDKSTTDEFFLALTLPWLVVAPVMNAIGSVLVPVLVDVRARDPERLLPVLRGVLTLSLLLATGFGGIAWLVSSAVNEIGSTENHLRFGQVATVVIQLLPLMFLHIFTSVLDAVANAQQQIRLPVAGNLARQISTYVVIIVSGSEAQPFWLPIAFTIGAAIHLATCVVGIPGSVRFLLPTLRFDPTVRRVSRLSAPTLLGTFFLQVGAVGSRIIAGFLGPGAITAYDLAVRAYQAVIELISSAFLTATLSDWSHRYAIGDAGSIAKQLRLVSEAALFISIPVVGILASLATPVIAVWLGYRDGAANMVPTVATVWIVLLIAVPLDFLARVYVRSFLAAQDSSILGWLPAVRVALSLAIGGIMISKVGLLAVGLGELTGIAATLLVLGIAARRHVGSSLAPTCLFALRLVPIAAATCIVVRYSFDPLLPRVGAIVSIILASCLGLATYLSLTYAIGLRLPAKLFHPPTRPLRTS